jgi:deoxyribonucleoside regulator
MPHNWNSGMHVVTLNGGTGRSSKADQPVDVAVWMANSAQGYATVMPVPAILGRTSTKLALEEDPTIATVLHLAEKVPIACFAVGGFSGRQSVLAVSGMLIKKEVSRLKKLGAVGDILGRFINGEGEITDEEIDARTLGLPLVALRKKPIWMCVSGGASKHLVLRAALRASYFNVLISDEKTAEFLLGGS